MISIVSVWKSVQGTAKQSTTGFQTEEEFNNSVELVQLSILKAIAEYYEREQVISDDLSHLLVTLENIPTDKPNDYFRFVSATINGDEVYPIHRNAVAMTKNSPIRGNVKSFYFDKNKTNFILPEGEAILTSDYCYIKRPPVAKIRLNYSEDDGSDYLTPVAVTDLDWPDSVRNLIEAMLLERLGVETRETIAMEFGRIGIQRETSNYQ